MTRSNASSWEINARIVRRMYEVIGYQNGSCLEDSLLAIARYVSFHEGRKFSVDDVKRVYKSITAGNLESEVKCARKTPVEEIWRRAAEIRSRDKQSRAYHVADREELKQVYENLPKIFRVNSS